MKPAASRFALEQRIQDLDRRITSLKEEIQYAVAESQALQKAAADSAKGAGERTLVANHLTTRDSAAAARVVAYLDSLYQAAIQNGLPMQETATAEFIAECLAAWPQIDESERLRVRLHEKFIAACAASGREDLLRMLATELAPRLGDPRYENAAVSLLRHMRQPGLTKELTDVIVQLVELWPLSASLAVGLMPSLAFAVTASRSLDDLARLARIADFLVNIARAPNAEPGLVEAVNERLPPVLCRTGSLDAMRELSARLSASLDRETHRRHLTAMLTLLHRWKAIDGLESVAEQVFSADRSDLNAAWLWAKLLAEGDNSMEEIESIFSAVPSSAPQHSRVMLWLANQYHWRGKFQDSLRLYDKIPDLGPIDANRAAEARIQTGRIADRIATVDQSLPTESPRLAAADIGPFAAPLSGLVDLVNLRHAYGEQPDEAGIRAGVARSLGVLSAFLETTELDSNQCFGAAHRLFQIARASFDFVRRLPTTTSITLGESYGTLDPKRFQAIYAGMLEHAAMIARHALNDRMLSTQVSGVYLMAELAILMADSLIDLERADEARRQLESLRIRAGPVCQVVLTRLIDRCLLNTEVGDADSECHGWSSSGTLHRICEFEDWCCAEKLQPSELFIDPAINGSFDSVRRDGAIRRSPHVVPQTILQICRVAGLRIRASVHAFGPAGTLLSPSAWHFMRGYPPPEDRLVLSRGRQRVHLRPADHWEPVGEPVLVLGNMDATIHHNYYHWTLLILTRINEVNDRGLLDRRRLLLPAEVSDWMRDSLAVVGVPEHRILFYHRNQQLVLEDALLVSMVDYASRRLVRSLRAQMWRHAGVEDSDRQRTGRLLFLSRKGHSRRLLIDEDATVAAALRSGFEVIYPETLSIADQVRLFSEARAVVGQGGAAFTNLAFAPDGIRVLMITKEEIAYPTYVDLSAVLDQQYRWLLGWTEGNFGNWLPMATPYRISLELLERELAWAASEAPYEAAGARITDQVDR